MIFLGMPIKISQTFTIVKDWIRNLLSTKHFAESTNKYKFVYFSYRPDFEYLYLSVHSLISTQNKLIIGSITIFVDQKAPFNDIERNKLLALSDKIVFEKVYGFSWASTETTIAEIRAFMQVIESASPNDMIVKVDSDIVFFKNQRLSRILVSKYNAVGDGHHVDYKYAQGGLYMFRAELGKRILNSVDKAKIEECEKQCNNKGEDIVISTLFKNAAEPFYLTRLMLFPDEYRLIKKLNDWLRWEFCAAHFVKDKDKMFEYSKKYNE